MTATQCRREAEALWRAQKELLLRACAAERRADELDAEEVMAMIDAREMHEVKEIFGPKVRRVA